MQMVILTIVRFELTWGWQLGDILQASYLLWNNAHNQIMKLNQVIGHFVPGLSIRVSFDCHAFTVLGQQKSLRISFVNTSSRR